MKNVSSSLKQPSSTNETMLKEVPTTQNDGEDIGQFNSHNIIAGPLSATLQPGKHVYGMFPSIQKLLQLTIRQLN